ncbi:MAG: glycosyltransferase family 2 protein [Lachnospiraceae bacterium]|nr:glycosyltransferase family 2 protein [Lachnospiraceae bacterium]
MKLLSVAVPCYNSEAYMRKCVESLLPGGEEVEIIIVDDGSEDATGAIADEYAEKFPGIVRVIHQKNGGHGAAVNAGIKKASGLYFKVVDSDDWVNSVSYAAILETLAELTKEGNVVDMVISNFVYEKEGSRHKKVMNYHKALPENQIFTWNDMGHMGPGKYFLMHSLIYRTQLLRDCGMKMPEHMFYVDNIFAFQPLPYVKTMYYLDENFYRYYIGRDDQSVNEAVMISRIEQQIKVNKLMVDVFAAQKITNKRLKRYMMSYLDIITTVTSILLIRSKSEDEARTRKELWDYIRKKDRVLYYRLQRGVTRVANMPGKSGRTIAVTIYKIYRKLYGFN